eukprot:GDKI01039171.1.p1 GENE.GDKI01039171.1~~GDKI01039171.1.p1  ORF type:complete len:493 (+),score=109.35 GDKI01039171.1:101-1579(+)
MAPPSLLLLSLCVLAIAFPTSSSSALSTSDLPLQELSFSPLPTDTVPSPPSYGAPLNDPKPPRSPKITGPGSPVTHQWSDEEVARRLDVFLEAFVKCRQLPNVQIGLVRDGRVIYMRGMGVANSDGKHVDSRTLFGIGSTSKAFTGLTAAMLAAQQHSPLGASGLDSPVHETVPEFIMHEPAASALVSWRDLLSHRTGLARHDQALMVGNNYTQQELVAAVRWLRPTAPIRGKWMYNNWMVAAAGYMAAQKDGRGVGASNWAEMIEARILQPLGMHDTRANYSSANRETNRAEVMQWNMTAGRFESIEWAGRVNEYIVDHAAPAGAMNSNAEDMVKWLLLHLGNITIPGVSQHVLRDVHRPAAVIDMPEGVVGEEIELSLGQTYGAGWVQGSYRGRRRISHNGQTIGYSATVSMLPDDGIGLFAVSSAMTEGNWYHPVAFHAFDLALGLDPLFDNATQACVYPCPIFPDHPLCTPRPPPQPAPTAPHTQTHV